MIKHQTIQNPHLDGNTFYFSGNGVGVLLFHGFTATTVEVRGLAEYLHQQGLAVSAPLLPGHGTMPEDLLPVTWKDWIETAERAYLDVAGKHQKVIVCGESLGGLLSLYLAAHYQQILGVVLYAPAVKVKRIWQAALLWPLVKIIPKRYGGRDEDGHLPWQGYNVIVVPAANQLRKFQKKVRRVMPKVRQPVLIFQGEQDHTVDPSGAQLIYNSIGSKEKELLWMQRSGHCIILHNEREQVYKKTHHFIESVLESGSK